MGAGASLILPAKLDQMTFREFAGDKYNEEIFNQCKLDPIHFHSWIFSNEINRR